MCNNMTFEHKFDEDDFLHIYFKTNGVVIKPETLGPYPTVVLTELLRRDYVYSSGKKYSKFMVKSEGEHINFFLSCEHGTFFESMRKENCREAFNDAIKFYDSIKNV